MRRIAALLPLAAVAAALALPPATAQDGKKTILGKIVRLDPRFDRLGAGVPARQNSLAHFAEDSADLGHNQFPWEASGEGR